MKRRFIIFTSLILVSGLGFFRQFNSQTISIGNIHISIFILAFMCVTFTVLLLSYFLLLKKPTEDMNYQALMKFSPDALIVLSNGKISFVNQCALDLYEVSNSSYANILGKEGIYYIHPEDRKIFIQKMQDDIEKAPRQLNEPIEVRIVTIAGRTRYTEASTSFIHYKGKPSFLISLRDITDRKETEQTLRRIYQEMEKKNEELELQRDQLQKALKNLSDIQFSLGVSSILAITDENGIITYVNDKFCEISRYDRSELLGRTHQIINSRYHDPSFFSDMWHTIRSGHVWKGEIRNRAKDGKFYWVDTTIVPFLNEKEQPYQYVAIRHDITSRKETERQLKKMNEQLQALVQVDGLTGIGNRRFFDLELEKHWNRALRNSAPLSVILLDVDHFKLFNDYYGHQAGDECLKQVANVIRTALLRTRDIGARYGGEEFVILLPDTDQQGAFQVAERIRIAIEELETPHLPSPVSSFVTSSLGVATILPNYINHPKELVAIADKALYQSKKDGRNCTTFFTATHTAKHSGVEDKNQAFSPLSSIVDDYLSALHAFDPNTWGHSNRVAHYAMQLAKKIGLSSEECQCIYTAGLLHDIGKLSIPASIIQKPDRLTAEEYEIIKEHSIMSYEKLNRHDSMKAKASLLNGVLYHHERWDGAGYPYGLKGTKIPLSARVVAVADAFDAMIHNRIYQQGIPIKRALKELEINKELQFDPNIVDAFIELLEGANVDAAPINSY